MGGVRNAWVPDLEHAKLPQWVQLDLPEPAEISAFHVSFQTRQNCGVDFDVQAMVDGGWRNLATVRNNLDRRRAMTPPFLRHV